MQYTEFQMKLIKAFENEQYILTVDNVCQNVFNFSPYLYKYIHYENILKNHYDNSM